MVDYVRSVDKRLAVILSVVGLVVLLLLIVYVTRSTSASEPEDFRETVEEVAQLSLLRPIVVSIFERASADLSSSEISTKQLTDQDTYHERLVIVRPNNWNIYTNNGITFHYVTSNVSDNRLNCSSAGSLTAIEYRLKQLKEQLYKDKPTRNLRFSCINYTQDQLTRVFAQSSNRTDIDLTDYFDKKKNSKAPDFTVPAVIQFLVTNLLL